MKIAIVGGGAAGLMAASAAAENGTTESADTDRPVHERARA